jgi:hypothetical protein
VDRPLALIREALEIHDCARLEEVEARLPSIRAATFLAIIRLMNGCESDSVVSQKRAHLFFRIKKSGTRGYVQVVENKRIDGEVRQSVIATLGRTDELAAAGTLPLLLASGARLCDQVLRIQAPTRMNLSPCLPSGLVGRCCSDPGSSSRCFLQRFGRYSRKRRSSFTALVLRHGSPITPVTASSPRSAICLLPRAAAYLPIWCSALLLIGIAQLPHDDPWFVAAIFLGDL